MKRVVDIDPQTGDQHTIATFTIVDGQLRAEYADDDYRFEVEVVGITTYAGLRLRPRDGKPFYDAVDRAYDNSSFRAVVTS